MTESYGLAEVLAERAARGRPYLEFLRRPAMTAGVYVLPAGGADEQQPHAEDEVYVVLSGRSQFTVEGDTVDVNPGDTIVVPAGAEHRFHDIEQELVLVVVFAPAEYSKSG